MSSAQNDVTLVLGMVYARDSKALSETMLRDYVRLRALQKNGFNVIALSADYPTDVALNADRYIKAKINTRGALSVVGMLGNRKIKNIFCEFCRIPGCYVQRIYSCIGSFVNALTSKGALAANFELYIPNYSERYKVLSQFENKRYSATPVHAEEYPLYETMLQIERSSKCAMLGKHTTADLAKYDSMLSDTAKPFVIITYLQ